MSDLSLQLQQAHSQLPVSSYFDEALFAREMEALFKNSPRYVGHRLAVPEIGDFHTLPQERHGRALLRTQRGVELVSNVCRHRQAVILQGRGSLPPQAGGNIVCPLHRWTYSGTGLPGTGSLDACAPPAGTLLGAPHFPQDPCLNLRNYPLQEWNGLLFDCGDSGRDPARDMAGLEALPDLRFEGFQLDHVELHMCDYNWKTFIEVYLEDYHVGPFHPGLGQFVACEDLQWQFGEHFSVQKVGADRRLQGDGSAQTAGSPVYQRWHKELMAYRNGLPPEAGAVWLTYYPTVMVEWYPHVLTVSTLHPLGPQKTLNMVEFFYPEEIVAFERGFVEAQRAAYMETCVEDDEIALRMDAGRQALMLRGDNEVGPYQSPMEDGMQRFHEWYRARMQSALPG